MGLRGLNAADPFSCGSSSTKEKTADTLSSLRNSLFIYKVPGKIILPPVEIPETLKLVLRNNLKETLDMSKTEKNLVNFLNKLTKAKISPPKDHLRNLKILVMMEQYYIDTELNKHGLTNQRIEKSSNSLSPYFSIKVPDLDIDDPFVTIGDEVVLNGKHHLRIIDIENGKIEAQSQSKLDWFDARSLYNVTFKLFNYTVRCTLFALKQVSNSSWANNFLHPVEQTKTVKVSSERQWSNLKTKKNPEQKQAIDNIIQKTANPAAYILFGPPGTGKTATLVEAIYQIYSSQKNDRILVCAPSNTAADELTKRLLSCVTHTDILRLYSHTREMHLIDKSILPCANVDRVIDTWTKIKDENAKRKMEILGKRIIISTLMNSLRLLGLDLPSSYFSYVFIDEAGQATEPEALIPLTLLVNFQKTKKSSTQVVLAGDPMQLGPVVKSKLVENLLGMSLMERLMSLPVYKKNENNKYNPLYITKLINNFRSHSAILTIPNQLFYDSELKACATKVHRAENWQCLPNKRMPLIFHAVSGSEMKKVGNTSTYNKKEIDVIADYIKKILAGKKFTRKDIAVITPFKLQEKYIKKHLFQKKLSDIDVGTVQLFQGQEREVIILSTVRSRLLQNNGQVHIGFLGNEKRFNVSITRAKSLLIIIGNPHVLKFADHWRSFLSYCLENKACMGEQFSLDNSNADRQRFIKPPVYVSDSSDDEDDSLGNLEYRPQLGQSMILSLSQILESESRYVKG